MSLQPEEEGVLYLDDDDEATPAAAPEPEQVEIDFGEPDPTPSSTPSASDDPPAPAPPSPAPAPTASTELLELARSMGYVPEAEWKKDAPPDGGFKTPAEFIQDTQKINARLKDDLKALRDVKESNERLAQEVQDLKRVHQAAQSHERDRALGAWRERRHEAIRAGDPAQVEAVDREYYQIRQRYGAPETPTDPVQTWQQANPWYGQDQARTQQADDLADWARGQGFSAEQALALIDRELTAPPRAPGQPAVEAPTGPGTAPRVPTFDDLPEHFQEVGRAYERAGVMSKDDFVRAQIASGNLVA